ncbi:hypothetical protein CATYP_08100 [Corynebacterium atypicum]|uniref:S1 motif domain-containing protein n=1 Tax=Corynebacterium atypicum TaxID=191610 RepID=A0ABN4DDZ4_9CORY|nr:translation initiation factor IF-2 N-terminal domain-containing protein [Corynebacterium atypicum]AIG64550.1 hypothetical protein CATYP_08100 [Corynebacterium atypicum]
MAKNSPEEKTESSDQAQEKKPDWAKKQKPPAGKAEKAGKKKAVKKRPAAKKKQAAHNTVELPAEALKRAGELDREALKPKTRVHALAKTLGLSSRELVAALGELGIKKVAQSSLSIEEQIALLDAVGEHSPADAPAAAGDEAAAEAAEEATESEELSNIRVQVENNVANEINQIERKVNHELEERVEEAQPDQPAESDATEEAGQPEESEDQAEPAQTEEPAEAGESEEEAPLFLAPSEKTGAEPKRRRGRRARRAATRRTSRRQADQDAQHTEPTAAVAEEPAANEAPAAEPAADGAQGSRRASRRRRGRRGAGRGRGGADRGAERQAEYAAASSSAADDASAAETTDVEAANSAVERVLDDSHGQLPTEPVALKGSTRLEAKRRRRSERREESRQRRHVLTEEEFLARRESVKREMVVRERDRHDHPGTVVQVGVLEDELLVEHFVTSETQSSIIGNLYLGRVQNVLPSMEAAFIDIGQGRNGVLYAGEVDWRAAGLGGRSRRIEQALKSGDQVVVQVTKDPVGHKGARLTTQISLAGRYLVYVPGGKSAGISRKLPVPERNRLKKILGRVMPEDGGAIIRTAAEGVDEDSIAKDVRRLHRQWEDIQKLAGKEKKSRGSKPVTLYEEPPMLVKVVRDLFNEDFTRLIVDGEKSWNTVSNYVESVAPDLVDRLEYFHQKEHGGRDAFEVHRVDEQIKKALGRVVCLPSGGSLVIDRTEAMTVIDVNTGRFTGSGGNLEETVTRNNLEAAEEIVRQLRLRDIGGMVVIDFIDMVLPENRDLVLRRLTEALSRDRTRHQVSEVTSLGLVQLTRKRLGTGLLETFSTRCECCGGRGIVLHDDPVEGDHGGHKHESKDRKRQQPARQTERQDRRDHRHHRDDELEHLAAAVVAKGPAEEADGQNNAHDKAEDGEYSGRRRRSRSRRSRRAQLADAAEEITQIADAAVEHADAADPEEPSGASYEQAVEEFEKSPRRKRRTRGNSRSDRRPRREDFEAQRGSTEHGREDRAADDADDSAVRGTTEQARPQTPTRRRKRRVARRATPRAVVGESRPPAEKAKDAPRRAERQADPVTSPTRARRARRRAIRHRRS